MIDYQIPAIPTLYKGRLYRSRLEAKWAAFFDLCGWEAEYEPVDLGAWSPDFSIAGAHGIILVEVKPISALDNETITKMHAAACETGFQGQMLLLGMSPNQGYHQGYLGWLDDGAGRNNGDAAAGPWFCEAPFAWYADKPGQIDFCHSENGFNGRITGLYDGGSYGTGGPAPGKSPEGLWAIASNTVQWHPR